MRSINVMTFAAILMAAVPVAHAAAPILSGTYMVNITTFCGIAADPWPDGLTTTFDGNAGSFIGKGKFTSTTGTAALSGFNAGAQVIVPNSTGGSVIQSPAVLSGAYSTTASTLTFAGTTYNAVFGGVVKGIAHSVLFSGSSTTSGLTAPNCVINGTATLVAN